MKGKQRKGSNRKGRGQQLVAIFTNFFLGKKEVQEKLYGGVNVGGFIPLLPFAAEFMNTLLAAELVLKMGGLPFTSTELLKLERVKTTLTKLVLQAHSTKGTSSINLPCPAAAQKVYKPIIDELVNKSQGMYLPMELKVRTFEIVLLDAEIKTERMSAKAANAPGTTAALPPPVK